MKLSKVALMAAVALAGMTCSAANKFFIKDKGDVSGPSGNSNYDSGTANVYFQGGYKGAYSGYLPAGKSFSYTGLVYVYNEFTLNIQGGTFDAISDNTGNPTFSIGTGTVNQSGGVVNAGPESPKNADRTLCVAYDKYSGAAYNLSGGTLNARGDSLLISRGSGSGTFTQTGGTLDTSGGKGQAVVIGAGTSTGVGTVNLKGGVAKVGRFYQNNNATAAYLNFDGGTVQPLAASDEFIGSTAGSKKLTANVLEGGAIFDTAYDITSCLPLLSGAATDGGLTKRGSGMLTLANGNTYNGPTVIEKGAVKIPNGATFTGGLEIMEGAWLVISGAENAKKGGTVATFDGGITLHADEQDKWLSFASSSNPFMTFKLSDDGKSVVVDTPAAEVPASPWTLDADLDLRNFDGALNDLTIDLNGHNLAVRFTGGLSASSGLTITSGTGLGGDLSLYVPAGAESANAAVAITGSLAVRKTGGGTYVSKKASQTYTGGTFLVAGTWKTGIRDQTSFGAVPAGEEYREVSVGADATLDFNGVQVGYSTTLFTLAGGSMINSGASIGSSFGDIGQTGGQDHLYHLRLTADSLIGGNNIPVLAGSYRATDVDMGGHKLTVAMNDSRFFYLCNTTVTGGGTVEVTGGYLVIGGYQAGGGTKGADISMPTTSLIQSGTGGVRLQWNLEVLDYTCSATNDWLALAGKLTVNGALRVKTDKFVKTTVAPGGTNDVSWAEGPVSMVSSIPGQGYVALPGSVVVDTGTRELVASNQVLSWNEVAATGAYETVTFVPNAEMIARRKDFEKQATGLYVCDKTTPEYATRDVSAETHVWRFFDASGKEIADWEEGVTEDIWVRFSSDAEYESIKATGTVGKGLVLTAGSLPENDEPAEYDWTSADFSMYSGATFDLKGNILKVPASVLTGADTAGRFVSTKAGGIVRFTVASGEATSSAVGIGAGVTFEKYGAGTLVWSHNDTGANCVIKEGTLKGGVNNGLFATITIEKDTVFDFNGTFKHTAMKLVSNGGTITTTTAINWNNDIVSELEITEDTTLKVEQGTQKDGGQCTGWGMRGGNKKVTLNGKTLTIQPNSSTVFWFFGTTFADAGTVVHGGPGYVCLHDSAISAPQVTLVHSGGAFIHNQNVTLKDYRSDSTNDKWSYGTAKFFVSGTFEANTDKYMNTEMLDGSTLCLTNRTTALSTTGTCTHDKTRNLTFAANAKITVDVCGRKFSDTPTKVLSWGATGEVKPADGVTFELSEASKNQCCQLQVGEDGLYVTQKRGFMILLK